MKQRYLIARNAIDITVDAALPAWQAIGSRYEPFVAVAADGAPVLDVRVTTGTLPDVEGECVYTPKRGEIGILSAEARRMADGTLAMDFSLRDVPGRRMSVRMPASMDRANVVLADGSDADGFDRHLLTHAIMVAFMLSTTRTGTLLVHSSAVVCDGRAYLFQGKSGTGKSTHAALWTRHVEGAELLNDDNPVIRFDEAGVAMAYGSPWSGKTPCYRNVEAPLGAMVRIVRAPSNWLERLTPLQAYASLTTTVFYLPFMPEPLRALRHRTLERLAATIPCCAMHCLPNADAARVCYAQLKIEN